MRKVKLAVGGVFVLAAIATGFAWANAPAPEGPGGATCGAWEWIGGTSFRRLCIDGSLYWYEYR